MEKRTLTKINGTHLLAKLDILSAHISMGTREEFKDKIFELARSVSSFVCFANVHMVIEAWRDHSFRQVLNAADIAAPDGSPLYIFMRLFYGERQPRICGMDFMPLIMREAEKRCKSVFFYGSKPEILALITKKSKVDFPRLRIAGTFSPPFRPLGKEEDKEVVKMINSSNADFVFVSLGCPKQEKWMHEHRGKVNACMLGVGQAFMVYAGIEKRLPRWMRNLSLEWIYRLYQDPKRLWKRYLVTNSIFLVLVFREFLRGPSNRSTTAKRNNWQIDEKDLHFR